MKPILFRAPLLCALLAALPAFAQTQHEQPHGMPAMTTASADALPWVSAEVRRIDTAAGKISLKHGEIPNLDMPPMTMVFQVRDPARLGELKVGDKVRFTVDQVQGAYTVQQIEKAP